MDRLLIIPAAGLGSRLGSRLPKLLTAVNGSPMLNHLLRLYAPVAEAVALIVHPLAVDGVRKAVGDAPNVSLFVQERPTGMLDAILLARPAVEAAGPRRVWITWCDQLAIRPRTLARLVEADTADPLLALPTCEGPSPYVHLARDENGRIVRVLHRREGDAMPEVGESDAGLFSLSRDAYLELLPRFARDLDTGAGTGERNFLPFIPWAAAHGTIVTLPCEDRAEAVGVNTPAELEFIERTLRAREGGLA